MGFLNKLEEKLYKIDSEKESEEKEIEKDDDKRIEVSKEWEDIPKDSFFASIFSWWERKKKTFIIFIIILILLLFSFSVAVFVFKDSYLVRTYIFREIFSEKEVNLEADIPKKIKGGKEVEYVIKYSNTTRVALKDAKLFLIRPKDFKLTSASDPKANMLVWEIGEIAPKSSGQVSFKGVINTKKVDSRNFDFELKYQPANISSFFTKKISYTIEVEDTAIDLTLGVPDEVVVGREVQYTIDCVNGGDTEVNDLDVRVEYPEGFSFFSSEPVAFKNNNVWKIDTLSKSELFQISIKGILNGKEMQPQSVRVLVGRDNGGDFEIFKEELMSSTLISSPLVLNQYVNDQEIYNANAGEKLKFVIKYKNDTSLTINNIRLNSILEDKNNILDLSSLSISDGGKYDGKSKIITWQVGDNPNLAILTKGSEGQVSFSVNLKQYLPIVNFQDKNFVFSNKVIMTGSNIPVSIGTIENSMAVKVNSKLILNLEGKHNDSIVGSFGSIPLKVGETTSFALRFGLMNLTNDLKDVVIEANLPGDIEWTGETSCHLGKLEYNEINRKISWRIPSLGANVGFVLPKEECIFQIKITPQINQVGENIILLKEIKAGAKDSFTNIDLNTNLEDFKIEDIQDIGSESRVVN